MIYSAVQAVVKSVIRAVINGDGGYTFVNAEAETLVAAMSVQPSAARKQLIDQLITSLKSAGIWSVLDNLQVYAAHDSQAALLNWKAPGVNDGSLVNAPAFTADLGFKGNGSSSYINTNFNPTDGGLNFAQDSASWGVWLDQHDSAGTADAGQLQGAFTSSPAWGTFVKHYNSTTPGQEVAARDNNGSTVNFTSAVASHLGLCTVDRASSSEFHAWRNGTDLGASLQTSVAPQNKDFFALAADGATGAANFIPGTAAVSFAGASFAANQTALYNALYTYLHAIGAV